MSNVHPIDESARIMRDMIDNAEELVTLLNRNEISCLSVMYVDRNGDTRRWGFVPIKGPTIRRIMLGLLAEETAEFVQAQDLDGV